MQIVTLIFALLAVARLSMLVVDDRLLLGFRQWVIRKRGADSLWTYMILCHWCISIWIGLPLMPATILIVWGINTQAIVLSVLSIPVASLVSGLLGKTRGVTGGVQ